MNYLATPVLMNILKEGNKVSEDSMIFFNYDEDTLMLEVNFNYQLNEIDNIEAYVGGEEVIITLEQKTEIKNQLAEWYEKNINTSEADGNDPYETYGVNPNSFA